MARVEPDTAATLTFSLTQPLKTAVKVGGKLYRSLCILGFTSICFNLSQTLLLRKEYFLVFYIVSFMTKCFIYILVILLYVYSMNPSLYTAQCTRQAGHGKGRLRRKDESFESLWSSTIIYLSLTRHLRFFTNNFITFYDSVLQCIPVQ